MQLWRLLLVDDEPLALEFLSQAIDWEAFGFVVSGKYANSQAVLDHIQTAPVDAIITDIKMPKYTGIDLTTYCHQHYPQITFVLISAYSNFEYAQKAIQHNVVDYLLKPFSYDALIAAVKHLGEHIKNIQGSYIERSVSQFETPAFNEDLLRANIVTKTQKFIQLHFREDISLADAASNVALSPQYFSTLYKRQSGESFTTTINRVRIEEAKKLLLNDDLKASNLFQEVGYTSYRYFFKIFKDLTGLPPGEYRRHKGNAEETK